MAFNQKRQVPTTKLHPRVKNALEKAQEPVYIYSDQDIENIENVDSSVKYELVKFPDPPIAIQAHSSGQQATIWWEYKTGKEPIISWEVRRYKLDKDGSWSVKGVRQFKDVASRKVIYIYRLLFLGYVRDYLFEVFRHRSSKRQFLPLYRLWNKQTR
jgi:hypothetical protein